MKLFDDAVLMEFQKEEWREFNSKSSIIIPDAIKEKR